MKIKTVKDAIYYLEVCEFIHTERCAKYRVYDEDIDDYIHSDKELIEYARTLQADHNNEEDEEE